LEVLGLPIFAPLALALRIPDLTLSLMMRSSNSANTPDIWMKAFVIGSSSPLEQSTCMLPTIDNRRCLAFTVSMMSHNCFVLLARRETSKVSIVSPACACSRIVVIQITIAKPSEAGLRWKGKKSPSVEVFRLVGTPDLMGLFCRRVAAPCPLISQPSADSFPPRGEAFKMP